LIISHHPIIFKGLKSLTGKNYVERTVLLAIQRGIAIYAIHTNLDNVIDGVNGEMASRLGLRSLQVLVPKPEQLRKLVVFVPTAHAEEVRNALFKVGAGHVGAYDQCSFNSEGQGTFRGGEGTDPFVGEPGVRHTEVEVRVEVIFRAAQEGRVLRAMREKHPYEEVAHDIIPLLNHDPSIGAGLLGEWEEAIGEDEFLARLKSTFDLAIVRHTRKLGRPIKRVALCGGSGAFLINAAKASKADAYITSDVKYHEFFDADGQLLLADIGHYKSEQFTMQLLRRWLGEHFSTFAVHFTGTLTDPIYHS
ncbi:MAG TPA: Nif3-like dinuclear metal center hexameric protein, partial [Flavobacteriales bacterium]|nr:Nif3-like dinuclear metal center hexameric protein [Flavobacteriales bacterium]